MPETFEVIPAVIQGPKGWNGWSPKYTIVQEADRSVLQLTGWTGGEGTPPATGGYLSTTGLVEDIALAANLRGADGKPNEPFKLEIEALVAEMVASISESKTYKTAAESANAQTQENKEATRVLLRQATAAAQNAVSAQANVSLSAQAAERAKGTAETIKASVFEARDEAATASTEAQQALSGAVAAETGAIAAQVKAEAAQAEAEAAKVAAHTAQTVTTQARNETNESKAFAQGFAQDAATSASQAANTVSQVTTLKQQAIDQVGALKLETETVRNEAVTAKTTTLTAKTQAQNAQAKAETAQAGADTAFSGAAQAQAKAETAQAKAETAQGKAEMARTGAETARTGAETARAGAETARTGIETSLVSAQAAQAKAETALADTVAYQGQFASLTAFDFSENIYPNSAAGPTSVSNLLASPVIAPDGGTGMLYIEPATEALEHILTYRLVKPAIAQELTFTLFVKDAGRTTYTIWLLQNSAFTHYRRYTLNLATGTLTGMSALGSEPPTVSRATLTSIAGGWYRIAFTFITAADLSFSIRLDYWYNSNTRYVGDGVSGLCAYGPQFSLTNRPLAYTETSGQALPKTPFKVANDSTMGGATPSANLPASQQSVKAYAAPLAKAISPVSTNLTLAASDASKILPIDSPTVSVVTIPLNATVAIPVGSEIVLNQQGIGPICIQGVPGVTIRSKGYRYRTQQPGDTIMLRKTGINEWVASGDLAYPLDALPAFGAWGVRRLTSGYNGPVLQIRRASDNAETEVYFDSVDAVSGFSTVSAGGRLIDWAASSSLFVKTIYSQVNTAHFVSSVAAQQPQLILSGNLRNGGAFIRAIANETRMLANGDYTFMHDGSPMSLDIQFANITGYSTGRQVLLGTAASSAEPGFCLSKDGANNNVWLNTFRANSGSFAMALKSRDLNPFERLVYRNSLGISPNGSIKTEAGLLSSNYNNPPASTAALRGLYFGGIAFSNGSGFDFERLIIFKSVLSDSEVSLIQ